MNAPIIKPRPHIVLLEPVSGKSLNEIVWFTLLLGVISKARQSTLPTPDDALRLSEGTPK